MMSAGRMERKSFSSVYIVNKRKWGLFILEG